MKKIILVALSLLIGGWLNAQNITRMVYFFDTDPGYGNGTLVNIPVPSSELADLTFDIPVDGLSNGFHKLFIRCLDENNCWSSTLQRTIYKQDVPVTTNPWKVSRMEYFFDQDPGYGKGIAIPLTASEDISSKSVTIQLSDLNDGFHTLGIRAADDKGAWSEVITRLFYKETLPPSTDKLISAVEYFFDTDPGFGAGQKFNFTQGSNIEIVDEVNLDGLTPGFHRLFIRAKDQNGAWSLVNAKSFIFDMVPSSAAPTLTSAEYFIDTDMGFGKCTPLSLTPSSSLENYTFAVDLDDVPVGFHKLFIRFKDENSRWSHSLQHIFYKDTELPTTLPSISYAEYFIDSDNGLGKCTPIPVSGGSSHVENLAFSIPLNAVSVGFHKLYIRAKDANNRWGETVVRGFYKDGSTPNTTAQISQIKFYVGQGGELNFNAMIPVAVTTPSEHIQDLVFQVNLEGREVGKYYIYAVAKDMNGKVTHTAVDSFKVCDNVARASFTYEVASRTAMFWDQSQLATNYYWTFGDGYTSTESSPMHTYFENGKYKVCLTVSNDCNASTFCDSVEVVYNAPPTSGNFSVSINENQRYTFKSSDFPYQDAESNPLNHVLFTNVSLGTGDSLALEKTLVTNGTMISKADLSKLVFIPAFNQAGWRGSAEFRVHDGISYSEMTYTIDFSVEAINDPPTFTISNKDIVLVENCGAVTLTNWVQNLDDGDPNEDQFLNLNITVLEGGSIFSVNPQISQDQYFNLTFTIKASTTGKAKLRLTVTDNGMPSSTATEDFSIEVKPFAAQLTPSKTTACVGEEITFTSTSPTQDVNFAWDFGSGATPATFVGHVPPAVVYSTAGTKTAKLTISGFGRTDEKTVTLTILETPEASFITGSDVHYLYDTVYFTNTSTGGLQYVWNFGDGSPEETKTTTVGVKHKYVNAVDNSQYTPTLTARNGICTDVFQQTITLKNIAPPNITEENFATTYTISQGRTVSVKAEDLFQSLKTTAKFYYKGMAGNQWSSKTVNLTNGNTYSTTIEETMGDQVGIMYYFDVFNTLNIKRKSSVGYAYLQYPNGIDIPNITAGNTVAGYQIISMPLSLEKTSIDSVFDELGGYNNTQWRMFHYTPSKLLEYPEFTVMDKGKGYWFITRNPVKINTGVGTTHTGANYQEFKLSLRQGWTQIGNPYVFDVSWADIEAANPTVVDKIGNLRVFNNGNFEDGTVLKRFGGGFVFADQSGIELVVPIKSRTAKKSPAAQSEETFSPSTWTVNLQLTASNLVNNFVGFGMHPQASASKDRFDQMSMPRFIDYLEANFNHPEYFHPSFSTDIVPPDDSHTWEFTVESSLVGENTTLSWDNTKTFALPNELKLVDLNAFTIVDMKNTDRYSFQYDKPRKFKVFYGNQQFIDSTLTFGQTLLGDCYPNPFSQSTVIPVYIKGGKKGMSSITLSIYTIDGRKVATLAQGEYREGFYDFVWSVGGTSGLQQGVYLYSLVNTTEGTSITKRMVLIK
jgi:PKD repeat protein